MMVDDSTLSSGRRTWQEAVKPVDVSWTNPRQCSQVSIEQHGVMETLGGAIQDVSFRSFPHRFGSPSDVSIKMQSLAIAHVHESHGKATSACDEIRFDGAS